MCRTLCLLFSLLLGLISASVSAGVLSGGYVCRTYTMGVDLTSLPQLQQMQVEGFIADRAMAGPVVNPEKQIQFEPGAFPSAEAALDAAGGFTYDSSVTETVVPNFHEQRPLRVVVVADDSKFPAFTKLPNGYLLTIPNGFNPVGLSLTDLMHGPIGQETRQLWIYYKLDFLARAIVSASFANTRKDEALRALMRVELGVQTDAELFALLQHDPESQTHSDLVRSCITHITHLTNIDFSNMVAGALDADIARHRDAATAWFRPPSVAALLAAPAEGAPRERRPKRTTPEVVAAIEKLYLEQSRLPNTKTSQTGRVEGEANLYMFFYNRLRPMKSVDEAQRETQLQAFLALFSTEELRAQIRTELRHLYTP